MQGQLYFVAGVRSGFEASQPVVQAFVSRVVQVEAIRK